MASNKKKVIQLLKEYCIEIYLALVALGLTHFLLDTLEANKVLMPKFFRYLTEFLITSSVGILTHILIIKKQKSLNEIQREFKDISNTLQIKIEDYDQQLKNAILSDQITEYFYRIAEWNYNPETKQYIDRMGQDNKFVSLANEIVKKLVERIAQKDDWYIVFHSFLVEENANLTNCNFNLMLETYLNLYLEFIELYTTRAIQIGKKFVIYSFTNAIPWDWFIGGEAGNIMQDFRDKKVQKIEKMKKHDFRMEMITLTTTNRNLVEYGFRNFKDVEKDWLNTPETNKQKYLNRLHTSPNSALVAIIKIDNLEFFQNLTEFIYFGFLDNDKEDKIENIDWQACIAGGFSSKNKFLLARFDMPSDQSRIPDVISIDNESKILINDCLRPPDKIIIPLYEFPRFIFDKSFNGNSVELIKYRNIMPLADKWNLASQIWHTDNEAEEIKSLLGQLFRDKNSVLDAGCGTGFHTKILYELGKKVTAIDISSQELEILKKNSWTNNINVKQADWRTLSVSFKEEKFDAIICLGTSIPYYKSWDYEDHKNELSFNLEELKKIIEEFSSCLNSSGILVLGLSRHNEKARAGYKVGYNKNIDNHNYKMVWEFDLDWNSRKRIWKSEITTPEADIIRFSIIGHLFDHKELKEVCETEFENVQIVDIDQINHIHYDLYIVCQNKKLAEPRDHT